jgi:hypothetical protein
MAVVSSIGVIVTHNDLPDALSALTPGRNTGDTAMVADAGDALIHGYSTGLVAGAIILVVAAVSTALIINAKRPKQPGSQAPGDVAYELS